MTSYAGLLAATFALLLLVVLDWGIWWKACLGLSMDYDELEFWRVPRSFPNRTPFQIAKLFLGLGFVASFVVTVRSGASEHVGLAALSLTLLALFGVASFWESLKAFRHFAAQNLPPPDRGGYRKR
jgi:Na+/melibiose symporter-like transporter